MYQDKPGNTQYAPAFVHSPFTSVITPLTPLCTALQASLHGWQSSTRFCRRQHAADSRQYHFSGVNTGLTSVNIVLQNMKIGGKKVHFLRKINFLSRLTNFILPMNNRQETYVNMFRDTATFGASQAETLNSDPFLKNYYGFKVK